MQQTTNYNLNIIERSDNILDSVDALGQNATTIDTTLAGKIDTNNIATSISSASTNSEVASAKAVYDNGLEIYSTTEQRVGTWYDGKPLYEKTISTTTPTVSTDNTAVNGKAEIANNIDKVFILTSFVEYSGGGSVWTCPYYNASMLYVKTQIIEDQGLRKLQISSNGKVYNNSAVISVIRYTKTTDTANQ